MPLKSTIILSAICVLSTSVMGIDNAICQPVEVHRFDIDIQHVDFSDTTAVARLRSQHRPVVEAFIEPLIPDSTLSANDKLETFANLNNIKFFFGDINRVYPPTDSIQSELTVVKRNLEAGFDIPFPDIYTIVSPYNQSIVFLGDNTVAIALNHYLGADYEPYGYYPSYVRQFKIKPKIKYNLVEALLKVNFKYEPKENTLLERMLYEGAVACAAKTVIDNFSEALFFSFSDEQTAWLVQNEKSVWHAPALQANLFSSDSDLFRSMLGVAPFSAPISPQSPGGTGKWIGMKILQKYLSAENVAPADFLRKKMYQNSRTILNDSKYEKQ